jgi:hypothetical protein
MWSSLVVIVGSFVCVVLIISSVAVGFSFLVVPILVAELMLLTAVYLARRALAPEAGPGETQAAWTVGTVVCGLLIISSVAVGLTFLLVPILAAAGILLGAVYLARQGLSVPEADHRAPAWYAREERARSAPPEPAWYASAERASYAARDPARSASPGRAEPAPANRGGNAEWEPAASAPAERAEPATANRAWYAPLNRSLSRAMEPASERRSRGTAETRDEPGEAATAMRRSSQPRRVRHSVRPTHP